MVGSPRPLCELLTELGRSAAVVVITALLIAATDAVDSGALWWTIPAAGFLLLAFAAPAVAIIAAARVGARSWWPAPGEPSEPRRAAAAIYAGAALALGTSATYNAALIAQNMTSSKVAAAAATALGAVVAFAAIAGLAPLLCRLLGAALERATPRLGRLAPALFSRRSVLTWVGLALVTGGYVFYRAVLSPRLDNIAFSWMPPLALGAALLIAGHAALPARLGRPGAAVIAAVGCVSIASALVIRHASPRVMLDMWGDTDATSEAVTLLFDLEPIHEEYGVKPPEARADIGPRDVVLITVDTWRADRTPPFGTGAVMPAFARFARSAVRFDNALAPSNNTRRSITSMMIGAQPSRIRGRIRGWALALDPRHTLVAERFRAAGYRTVGFFCCRSLFDPERGTGFSRGIDRRVYIKDDGELAEAAAEYIGKNLARPPGAERPPVFLWVHLLGPHGWYGGSRKIPERAARRRYDRALGRIDEPLSALIEPLEDVREHAVVVMTSDHGEGLAEHGAIRHSSGLYQTQLRVPLVIAAPGIEPHEVSAPVSLIQLAPTLLELAGFEAPGPPEMDPGSVAPLVRRESADGGVVYAEQITDRSVSEPQWAVVAEGHKLIAGEDGATELYDLAADPDEQTDLSDKKPELTARLRAELERLRSRRSEPAW